ncbi:MAG: Hpt domain-containing protein [Treponema sp.]|nr:Hpt domain-containing protein [Treponema sp.]
MTDDSIYINVSEGSKRVMNNTKLYSKLLDKFKADQSLSEIKTALAEGDMIKAKTSAHALKGLTANLSLTELYNQCVELENQIKAGAVKDEQLNLFYDVYDKTLVEIDKVINQYA